MNVGLIGCGRVSAKHFKAIEENNLTLSGVYDIDQKQLPTNTPIYANLEYMFEDKEVDIISICTPSDLHAEMAIAAMDHGKHVILEKPIALNIEDANEVLVACRLNKVKLCVVVQNRFNIPIRLAQTMPLGDVLLVNATCRWNRPQDYFSDWQGSWERSGGVIINQLIHPLDMLLYLVGSVASVSAYSSNLCRDLPFPDTYVANLKFWNGAIGSFEGTVCAHPQNAENSITLVYEKGVIKIGGVALDQLAYILTDDRKQTWMHKLERTDIYGIGHVMQYQEMVSAIKEDREPTTNGFAALRALKLALAIHQSAHFGGREEHLE